jgi:hypothetical protein
MNIDDELSLTPEEERQLIEALLRQAAEDGTLGRDDLQAVTRRVVSLLAHCNRWVAGLLSFWVAGGPERLFVIPSGLTARTPVERR